MGGITAYDMTTGDKKWWVPNGGVMRDVTTDDPLFAGVTLPRVPALGGQPEVITTKTLVIHGTGRRGAAVAAVAVARWRRRRSRRRRCAGAPPQLYAFDKATGKQVGAVSIPQREHGGADDVHAPGQAVHRVRDGRGRTHGTGRADAPRGGGAEVVVAQSNREKNRGEAFASPRFFFVWRLSDIATDRTPLVLPDRTGRYGICANRFMLRICVHHVGPSPYDARLTQRATSRMSETTRRFRRGPAEERPNVLHAETTQVIIGASYALHTSSGSVFSKPLLERVGQCCYATPATVSIVRSNSRLNSTARSSGAIGPT